MPKRNTEGGVVTNGAIPVATCLKGPAASADLQAPRKAPVLGFDISISPSPRGPVRDSICSENDSLGPVLILKTGAYEHLSSAAKDKWGMGGLSFKGTRFFTLGWKLLDGGPLTFRFYAFIQGRLEPQRRLWPLPSLGSSRLTITSLFAVSGGAGGNGM